MKLKNWTVPLFFALLLIVPGASCSFVMPERYATYNGGRVNVDLPSGTKTAETDRGVDKDTSVVISLPDDTNIFIGKSRSPIVKTDLRIKLRDLMKDKAEPDRMVYVAASVFDNYGTVVEVLNEIRMAEVFRAGLLANRLRGDGPSRFAVQIPEPPDPNRDISTLKPNPLILVVSVTPDLKLKLNQDDYGSVNDSEPLSAMLLKIFQQRLEQHAYKPGVETRTDLPESERIEKTLIIKADRSIKYGDVIKVIDAVKGSGAVPIVLQIDDSMDLPALIEMRSDVSTIRQNHWNWPLTNLLGG
jgi:biopolymer transport protein ExbD